MATSKKMKKTHVSHVHNKQLGSCSIARVPVEILAEILSHVLSPADILALARCNKYFCATLVNNPSTTFIWRKARECCVPYPVPDPTPNFTEASYAAFLFDGGQCEICGTDTRRMYYSFSLRARLCKKAGCLVDFRKKMKSHHLYHDIGPPEYIDLVRWMTPLEPQSIKNLIYVRESDWDEAVDEYNRVLHLPGALTEYVQTKQARADRLPIIMEVTAVKLIEWRDKRNAREEIVRVNNKETGARIASREGWPVWDLLQSASFSRLLHSKNLSFEKITDKDFDPIRPAIEREIVKNFETRERKQAEHAHQKRRSDVEEHYNRLRAAADKQVLPTLPEFRKLPIIKVLQSNPLDPKCTVAKNLEGSFVANVLRENLDQWRVSARASLARVLGFSDWKNISKKKLHPVDRLTARFKCKKCDKVPKKYLEHNCLDFAGACAHRCAHLNKKQRAKEIWDPTQFVPDQHVIDAVTQVLTLCDTVAEDAESLDKMEALGNCIQCLSCSSAILMNVQTLVRHCKRHETPQVAVLNAKEADRILQHPIEYGLATELWDMSHGAANAQNLKIASTAYGCRHCLQSRVYADGSAAVVDAHETQAPMATEQATLPPTESVCKLDRLAKKNKTYNFNGLRSHMKEKHGIVWFGDEDFFCLKDVNH
ncbi:hypothetical protein A0H81_12447 [Grifola frondosa]|uniref:F-box domain-containing protein n=1 Tax=Grifola frondosa TaxID=5627 RepID=A0A1C7LUD4_GRIFR|nr:hypothetical protein A0H81_12447 [Grifola frondosa]